MEEIAAGKGNAAKPFMTAKGAASDAVWQSHRNDNSTAAASPKVTKGQGVAALPRFVEPQLWQVAGDAARRGGWGHEIKFDGYRMQLRVEGGQATLLTRKGLDWVGEVRAIVKAGAKFPTHHRRRGRGLDHAGARTSRPCRRRCRRARPDAWCSSSSTSCSRRRGPAQAAAHASARRG
jgi:hypothetical protein